MATKQKPRARATEPPPQVRLYLVTGELTIDSGGGKGVDIVGRGSAATLATDSMGNAFSSASLNVVLDGNNVLVILDGRQTELLLKLVGLLPYEDTQRSRTRHR